MSIDYFTVIVYGIVETPEMRQARQVMVDRKRLVCTKSSTHDLYRGAPGFCPRCGSATALQTFSEPTLQEAAKAYMPAGLDSDNDRDIDTAINDWVHEVGEGSDALVLGVVLHHAWHRDWGATVIKPTTIQRADAVAYLRGLGIEADPEICVVVGGS